MNFLNSQEHGYYLDGWHRVDGRFWHDIKSAENETPDHGWRCKINKDTSRALVFFPEDNRYPIQVKYWDMCDDNKPASTRAALNAIVESGSDGLVDLLKVSQDFLDYLDETNQVTKSVFQMK